MHQFYPRASFGGAQTLASVFLTILQNGELEEFSKAEEPAEVAGTREDGDRWCQRVGQGDANRGGCSLVVPKHMGMGKRMFFLTSIIAILCDHWCLVHEHIRLQGKETTPEKCSGVLINIC